MKCRLYFYLSVIAEINLIIIVAYRYRVDCIFFRINYRTYPCTIGEVSLIPYYKKKKIHRKTHC